VAALGRSATVLASSRYTAWRPKAGSLFTQYSTSLMSKDCGHTLRAGTFAALYSSIIFCA
jgi:hypothetical protein